MKTVVIFHRYFFFQAVHFNPVNQAPRNAKATCDLCSLVFLKPIHRLIHYHADHKLKESEIRAEYVKEARKLAAVAEGVSYIKYLTRLFSPFRCLDFLVTS